MYTPKQVGPAERVRHEDQTDRPEGWYDGVPSTEYRRHYIEKAGGPQQRAGPTVGASGAALPKGTFSGDTTYGTEFRPRTAPGYERAGRPADDSRDTGPFQGLSTYKDSFVKKVWSGGHEPPSGCACQAMWRRGVLNASDMWSGAGQRRALP